MDAFEIDIQNSTKKYRVSIRDLKKTAVSILKALGWKKAALGVMLVGDRKIQTMNKRYLKHDRPTDVISFSQLEGKKVKTAGSELVYMGDLVISLDTTKRQAKIYGNAFRYELAFYLCHGILHLMGYDDQSPKDAMKMDRKQKQILKKIGIKNASS